ncbi:hypothetical protein MMC18_001355 [Xylographa bjoerkii]|nr:hypothetical protein [Xylographa bjoerkii]
MSCVPKAPTSPQSPAPLGLSTSTMKAPSIQLLRALRAADCAQGSCTLPRRALSLSQSAGRPGRRALSQTIHKAHFSSSATFCGTPTAAKSTDRGPPSKEDTQTDFGSLDVLGNTPPPTTSIDACLTDGFHLDNGLKVGGGSGCFLVAGEAFSWRPWEAAGSSNRRQMINAKGQWAVEREAWGILDLVWPKPDMLILGLGASTYPISPETRKYINSLGIKVDIQDTRNAAAQFNLLATERGVGSIAAALIPIGFKGH